ncbi:MAG: PhoX family phosphatase [Rickettsiales bacterium]|nr:PhoX family phosphatase [Rickettsiales bacterium]
MHLDEIILARKISRRNFLKFTTATASSLLVNGCIPTPLPQSSLTFKEVSKSVAETPTISSGYSIKRLISWGDPLFTTAEVFNPQRISADDQALRFGYNNDFLAYLPINWGEPNNTRGLLHVNHEFPNPAVMRIEAQQQSVGFSVLEVKRTKSSGWVVEKSSSYHRRVTATTPIRVSGPAASVIGGWVVGTLGNCAGGVTPWGTVLTSEENFDEFFGNVPPHLAANERFKRYSIQSDSDKYNWGSSDNRFDVSAHPDEPQRFGWVVEYDPYDANKPPVKRTALGRFKHESASCTLAPDGRVVVYSGDDEEFEYLYRFVSSKAYDPSNRAANDGILDEGVLSVAKFTPEGMVQWVPLIFGTAGLDVSSGFTSQADVLIHARLAGKVVGATPMDRPEDVEVNPVTGGVYVCLTKNKQRTTVDKVNRRAPNPFGHIIELIPPQGNHAADNFTWELFLEAGDFTNFSHNATYLVPPSRKGWLANPDNIAFDPSGRIWIATDGQKDSIGMNDGLYAADTTGPVRGQTRLFFNAPDGAEVTGPCFTPDGKTLFLSIQHPGSAKQTANDQKKAWPDFEEGVPPRPSVIAITKDDDGVIGS